MSSNFKSNKVSMKSITTAITVTIVSIVLLLFPRPSSGNQPTNDGDRQPTSKEMGSSITKILNGFFASGYDKRVRPNYGDAPVEVGVTMFIISISTVSEVNMDFTTDFYFRQAWRDPRLSFNPLPGIDNLYVGAEVAEKIWVPDTFFANEKSASFHIATTFNTFLRIGHTGEVFRSIR
jgi:glycine receptor alpha-3